MKTRTASKRRAKAISQPMAQGGSNLGYSFTSSSNLYPSSQDTNLRGWRPSLDREVWQMVSQARHRAMISDGRYIYGGSGAVSGAVRKKADYAVGWAWTPTYHGTNSAFRDAAQPLIDRWCKLCDVRGGVNDWRLGLRLVSISLDRDGDCFAIKTIIDGSPRIQWVEGHRIGTPVDLGGIQSPVVPERPDTVGYAGMIVLSGVIVDEFMRPVGYNLLDPDTAIGAPQRWNIIPATSVVQFLDPEWISQSRGIPSVVRAILDWYDIGETREAEKIGTKARSSIAIVERNETGRREPHREALGSTAPTAGRQGLQTQLLDRGLIRYIKSNGDISAFESNKPGDAWQNFIDYITRGAFAGMDMPFEFAWDSSKIGSAGVRSMVSQVQRAIENRQAVMHQPAMSLILWAVATYMSRGAIPFTPDWWNWEFSYPSKYSIDIGRDSQNRREDVSVGIRSYSEVLSEDGVDYRDHLSRRVNDYKMAKELADAEGVPLEWILNPSGQPQEKEEDATASKKDEDEDE